MEAWRRWSVQAYQRMIIDNEDEEYDEEEEEGTIGEEEGNLSSSSLSLSLRINRVEVEEMDSKLNIVTNQSSSSSGSTSYDSINSIIKSNKNDVGEKSERPDTTVVSREEHSFGEVQMTVEDSPISPFACVSSSSTLLSSSSSVSSSSSCVSSSLNIFDGESKKDSISAASKGGWHDIDTASDTSTTPSTMIKFFDATVAATAAGSHDKNGEKMDVDDIENNHLTPGLQSNDGDGMKIGGRLEERNSEAKLLPRGQFQHSNSDSNSDSNARIITCASTSSPSLSGESHQSIVDNIANMTTTAASSNALPSSTTSYNNSAILYDTETDTNIGSIPLLSRGKISFGVSLKTTIKNSKKRPAPPGFGGLFGSEY